MKHIESSNEKQIESFTIKFIVMDHLFLLCVLVARSLAFFLGLSFYHISTMQCKLSLETKYYFQW